MNSEDDEDTLNCVICKEEIEANETQVTTLRAKGQFLFNKQNIEYKELV